jgi:mannose-6-phosphate isomerase-like protein (cupin superfamily)
LTIKEATQMPVIPARTARTHELPGTRFASLATPSSGARETSVWEVTIDAGTHPTPAHRLTREEVFVVLDGAAEFTLGGRSEVATAGDAVLVPVGVDVAVANGGSGPLRMLCCLPVGGQVCVDGESTFTPPWAE